jgi:bacterioferritin (cytochrome b1)
MKIPRLIKLLNRQLNREVSAMLRYTIEAASLNGESHATARTLYLNEVSEKVERAQYLADQIVALCGDPTLSPDIVRPQATLREMLRRDATEEQTDAQNYLELATEAKEAGLSALKQKMQEQAAIEHKHVCEMEGLLW